jgi:diguanylate cyclase (GGDEF)-like protein
MNNAQAAIEPDELQRPWRLSLTLFVAVVAAIGATVALTARSLSKLVDAQAEVTHSLLVNGTVKDLLNDMLDTETGARGFLLTGRASYLQPYYEGLANSLRSREALADALAHEPAAAAQLDVLNRAIAAKLQVLGRSIELKTAGRSEESAELLMTDEGKRKMDAVRDAVRVLAVGEGRRIEQYQLQHAREVRITYWILAASIGLNMLLLGGLVQRMRKAAAQSRASRQAMAERNGELSRLLDATAARNQQVHALADLGRLLQSCVNMDEAGRLLQQQLPLLMRADRGAMYLFAASRNQLRLTFVWGDEPFGEYLEPGECWGLRLGQPYRQPEQGSATACAHLKSARTGSGHIHCLPLVAHGDLMGLLVLDAGVAAGGRADAEDDNYRRMTLEQVALSIGNLKLRESLRQQSIRDVLTGLFNRRFLEESVQRELLRASRVQAQGGQAGVALLMIDVDHFKRFNDQHGHEVGDRVLREVAQVLQRNARGSDVAARYGGEEFTVVLTDMPGAQGLERAEQLRLDVERMAIEVGGAAVGSVTVSIGLAQFPADGSSVEALFLAADKALYEAKRAGRNRVVIASPAGQTGGSNFLSSLPVAGEFAA